MNLNSIVIINNQAFLFLSSTGSLSFCLKNCFCCCLLFIRGHSKSTLVEEGSGVSLKSEQKRTGGGGPSMCVCFLFLKNAEIFKMRFYIYSPVFLLIIMVVWSIKQTIMKDYNIQSCQWMACDRFHQPIQDHNVGYVKNIDLQPLAVDWIPM